MLHETITSCDAQLVADVLERRDYQRYSSRIDGVPALLRKIRDVSLLSDWDSNCVHNNEELISFALDT